MVEGLHRRVLTGAAAWRMVEGSRRWLRGLHRRVLTGAAAWRMVEGSR